jgi:hypothetical protein
VQFIAEALGQIESSEQRLMDVRLGGFHAGLSSLSLMQYSQRLDSRLLKVESGIVTSFAYVFSPGANIVANYVLGWLVCLLGSQTDLLGLPIIEPSAVAFDLVNGRRVLLGSGGSSVVYKGTYKGEPVAVKVFRNMRPDDINNFVMEVSLHVDLSSRSSGVCKCYGGWDVIDADTDIFSSMILEYLPHSLSSVAHNAEKFGLNMGDVARIFLEIAKTFATLSEGTFEFYHNDLNPSNIMLTADFKSKLTDFGLAQRRQGPQSAVAEGTAAYMVYFSLVSSLLTLQAPEVFEGEPSDKADVYAFGMSLYEVLSGKRPFFNKYTHSIRAAVLKGERPDVLFLVEEFRNLIEKCWAQGRNVGSETVLIVQIQLTGRHLRRLWRNLMLIVRTEESCCLVPNDG